MKNKKSQQTIIDSYDYLSHAASTTDCTGLIPSLASDEEERASYEAIYPYLPPSLSVPKDNNDH